MYFIKRIPSGMDRAVRESMSAAPSIARRGFIGKYLGLLTSPSIWPLSLIKLKNFFFFFFFFFFFSSLTLHLGCHSIFKTLCLSTFNGKKSF